MLTPLYLQSVSELKANKLPGAQAMRLVAFNKMQILIIMVETLTMVTHSLHEHCMAHRRNEQRVMYNLFGQHHST